MSEVDADTRRQVLDNTVAIARFQERLTVLETERLDQKKLKSDLRMAVYAAIIGGLFTVTTLIEMARAALRHLGK